MSEKPLADSRQESQERLLFGGNIKDLPLLLEKKVVQYKVQHKHAAAMTVIVF